MIDEIVLDRATTEEACRNLRTGTKGTLAGLEIFGDASGRQHAHDRYERLHDVAELPVRGWIPKCEVSACQLRIRRC